MDRTPAVPGLVTLWLLFLQGEMVAVLEDAKWMGLYVDINTSTLAIVASKTFFGGRRSVPQGTGCILPHTTKFLIAPPQCPVAQGAPGKQAFCRVALSLKFAEVATPILWMVKSFCHCMSELPRGCADWGQAHTARPLSEPCAAFSCDKSPCPGPDRSHINRVSDGVRHNGWNSYGCLEDCLAQFDVYFAQFDAYFAQFQHSRGSRSKTCSGKELPATSCHTKEAPCSPSPGPETHPAGRRWAASSHFQAAGPAAMEASAGLSELPSLSFHAQASAGAIVLSSTAVPSAGRIPTRPRWALSPPTVLPPDGPQVHRTSPSATSVGCEQSEVFPVSRASVTLTEGLRTIRPEQDPAHSPGSPLLLGVLSGDVDASEPTQRGPSQAREDLWPLMKPAWLKRCRVPLGPSESPGNILCDGGSGATREGGQRGTLQEPTEPTLAASPESHRSPELQNITGGGF
ncbi:LOW QUALITY PROTEIN: uncharacterized protein C1orf127 homolog [Rhynchonycteris naso]